MPAPKHTKYRGNIIETYSTDLNRVVLIVNKRRIGSWVMSHIIAEQNGRIFIDQIISNAQKESGK